MHILHLALTASKTCLRTAEIQFDLCHVEASVLFPVDDDVAAGERLRGVADEAEPLPGAHVHGRHAALLVVGPSVRAAA